MPDEPNLFFGILIMIEAVALVVAIWMGFRLPPDRWPRLLRPEIKAIRWLARVVGLMKRAKAALHVRI